MNVTIHLSYVIACFVAVRRDVASGISLGGNRQVGFDASNISLIALLLIGHPV